MGATSAGLLLLAGAARVLASMPPATAVTPSLVEAARKEGRVNLCTSMNVTYAGPFAKAFEAKYPGIAVRVERSGSKRIFAQIAQECSSRIFTVDVPNTLDAAHV